MKSLKNELLEALKEFPGYLLGYLGGFVVFILTDPSITSLFLASVLTGLFATSVLLGAAIFFGGYVLLKSIGGLGDATVFSAQLRNKVEARKIQPPTDPPAPVG